MNGSNPFIQIMKNQLKKTNQFQSSLWTRSKKIRTKSSSYNSNGVKKFAIKTRVTMLYTLGIIEKMTWNLNSFFSKLKALLVSACTNKD